MKIRRILLILLILDILIVISYAFFQKTSFITPFEDSTTVCGEYEYSFLGAEGVLEVEERYDNFTVKIWSAENAPLSLLEQVPELMEKKSYTLVNSIPICETWTDEEYVYVFSHAVTDTGLCDYKFVRYPIGYSPEPGETIIDYAVAIDAE